MPRWGRFFGWSFAAVLAGFGVGSSTQESLGEASFLFAAVPTFWLFFGFLSGDQDLSGRDRREFPLVREWQGSFAARRKHHMLRRLEGLAGVEIFPDRVNGKRFRKRTWPDHEPFDTGHRASDVELACRSP